MFNKKKKKSTKTEDYFCQKYYFDIIINYSTRAITLIIIVNYLIMYITFNLNYL